MPLSECTGSFCLFSIYAFEQISLTSGRISWQSTSTPSRHWLCMVVYLLWVHLDEWSPSRSCGFLHFLQIKRPSTGYESNLNLLFKLTSNSSLESRLFSGILLISNNPWSDLGSNILSMFLKHWIRYYPQQLAVTVLIRSLQVLKEDLKRKCFHLSSVLLLIHTGVISLLRDEYLEIFFIRPLMASRNGILGFSLRPNRAEIDLFGGLIVQFWQKSVYSGEFWP